MGSGDWRGGRTEPAADPVSSQLRRAGRGLCVETGQRDDDSAGAIAGVTALFSGSVLGRHTCP